MEWLESIRKAIDWMEAHLLEENVDPSRAVSISPFYLQKGFRVMTGYTLGEYVRCRRLYLAGLDVLAGREKEIDIAFKYGYDTPESFAKAFARFHGVTPTGLKKDPSRLRIFLPLKIHIALQGGNDMDYRLEQEGALRVIGVEKEFSAENSYQEIPRFWDAFSGQCLSYLMQGGKPRTALEEAVVDHCVGMFGICLDDAKPDGTFRYLIAGPYRGGTVPDGMVVETLPACTWAKFLCKGPLPGSLQAVNTYIFRQWLPGNTEYEVAFDSTVEWYGQGDPQSADYECAIWVPVKKRGE